MDPDERDGVVVREHYDRTGYDDDLCPRDGYRGEPEDRPHPSRHRAARRTPSAAPRGWLAARGRHADSGALYGDPVRDRRGRGSVPVPLDATAPTTRCDRRRQAGGAEDADDHGAPRVFQSTSSIVAGPKTARDFVAPRCCRWNQPRDRGVGSRTVPST